MNHVLQPETEPTPPDDPQVLGLDDDSTQEALSALSSETARKLFSALYEEPQTPSELRETVGTSLQNVHYHLEKLVAADLIREVDTRYSEKGNEMAVYGPANEAVVFMAGDTEDQSLLRRALGRVLGALALLAAGSLAVGRLLGTESTPETGQTPPATGPSIASEEPARTAAETAANAPDPALVFFLGGLFVLAVFGAWWGYRQYR